jgi:thiamine biosynthesis lipoprotein
VGITDPFNPDGSLALLMLSGGGVATSGRDYRRWQSHGRTQHHLIDPRINAPAETDVLTATVIAEDVIRAEALSKQLLILGSSESLSVMDDSSSNAFFLVLEEGRTIESNHFSLYKWNETWTTTKKAITA